MLQQRYLALNLTYPLEKVLKKLVGEVRQSNGRKEKTSLIIVDAQSMKNTDTAQEKGYDAGKKIIEI